MRKRLLLLCLCAAMTGTVTTFAETWENRAEASEETGSVKQLSEEGLVEFTDRVLVISDCDVLDYPSRKDGEVLGEVLEDDQVTRTGTICEVWSRIQYEDLEGSVHTGYIPTSVLEGNEPEGNDETVTLEDGAQAGTIHKSEGKGIFADAIEGVTSANDGGEAGLAIRVGTPVSVSSDTSLLPLGTFRITHYCPCSLCCGPWSDGITSTGVTAITNHTIAVDPDQIPYGSKVVINGQVYVAEDCGGAIKENCIDVYVGNHAEGEDKGVYYTEVYLIQE
ncbi:MAG: 3D domain-containing protein [Eubacteriales bacterium]|nr:3D domain-containing protein [Eubacteriales bacterium]